MSRSARIARWRTGLETRPTDVDEQTGATSFTFDDLLMTDDDLDEMREEREWDARDRRLADEEAALFPPHRQAILPPRTCRPMRRSATPRRVRARVRGRRRRSSRGCRAASSGKPEQPEPRPRRPRRSGGQVWVHLSAAEAAALLAVGSALQGALQAAAAEDLVHRVADIVRAQPGATGRAIRAAAGGSHQRVVDALRAGAARGLLRAEEGQSGAQHWFVIEQPLGAGPDAGPAAGGEPA